MEQWCQATEQKLSSEDYGDSIQRIDSLMKNQALLEVDVAEYGKRVDAATQEGESLIANGNHLADEIQQLVSRLAERYVSCVICVL